MVEPVGPAASGKKSQPSKAKKRAPANLLPVQEGSSGGSMALTIDLSPELDSASLAKCSTEGVAAVSSGAFDTSFPAAHGHGQLSTSPPTPVRGPSVPASNSAQASRPSSGSKKSSPHHANKPRHAVLGKALVAQRQVPSPLAHLPALSPARAPQSLPSTRGTSHQPQTDLKPSADHTTHQALARAVSSNLLTQAYSSSQGHQVRFQEQAGTWMAQVEDVWGRTQQLPVVCAPDQTPERVLQQLSSKALGQHKYWVHVFNTHQPPWAPRVVYVGALGLRGGGQVGSTLKKAGRAVWGWASFPVTAVIYVFKDKIPPLPCRVTVLSTRDENDLSDSQVDNHCQAAGEWVTFHKDGGYWYAQTSRGYIPVKANRSASLSLEDLVNSRFSIRKFREKSFSGYLQYNFADYDNYSGLGYELELLTSPEEVQSNKEARRRQRREQKKREEERKREELEQKKEAERAAFVQSVSEAISANFYTSLDQADSLSEAHAAQRHSMVQSLAQGLTQNQERSLEHEVIKDGYLSDDELDYDLADNTGSGFDFGPTEDHLPIVGPGEAIGAEKKEEVPSSPEALAERLLHKQKCAQAFDRQERDLQRCFDRGCYKRCQASLRSGKTWLQKMR